MLRALRRQNRLREQICRAAYATPAYWTHGSQQQRQAVKSMDDVNSIRGAGFGGVYEVGRGFSTTPHPNERKPFDGNIFLHHSDIGAQLNSAALTVGLVHALQVLRPGVGYFRPIDKTSHGGFRADLIRQAVKLSTPLEDMYALTQDEAYALLTADNIDDMLERVLNAYERCKKHHDYLVVEGTSLRDGANTSSLNGLFASALDSTALLLSDAKAGTMTHPKHVEAHGDFEAWDWEKEAVASVIDHARIMKQANVDVSAALFYRTPHTSRHHTRLQQYVEEEGLPFLGAIPEDSSLEAFQVEDVKKVLNAHLLYGDNPATIDRAMDVDISNTVVGTLHLADLLSYVPPSEDPSRGTLVIAHASRPDLLLGMINLHETNLKTQVAAIVLTGGSPPPLEIDNLIRSRANPVTLPVFLAPHGTFETCSTLIHAQSELHPTSTRKIERAESLFTNYVDHKVLNSVLFKEHPIHMSPKLFQFEVYSKAREAQSHVVLPEGAEPRTVQAAGEVLRRGLGKLTLIGNPEEIEAKAKQLRVDLSGANIVFPAEAEDLDKYTDLLYGLRQAKGLTREEARELLVTDPNYYGTCMVASGDVDGMVSGAIHTTASTVRPALQVIKTQPGMPIVSSIFFMCLPDKVLVYGDCAINTNPTAEELAVIAISSADTAAAFGIEPRVALLSYATGDSNAGPLIQKVADAAAIVHQQRPDIFCEGPLQYDAAVNPETAKTKLKGRTSEVAGKATVLIFPDLNTGNNTYKAVQQSTGAVAMGPLLQGLRRPVNDLSRGCTVKDIVTTIAMTGVQAEGMKRAGTMGEALH